MVDLRVLIDAHEMMCAMGRLSCVWCTIHVYGLVWPTLFITDPCKLSCNHSVAATEGGMGHLLPEGDHGGHSNLLGTLNHVDRMVGVPIVGCVGF